MTMPLGFGNRGDDGHDGCDRGHARADRKDDMSPLGQCSDDSP